MSQDPLGLRWEQVTVNLLNVCMYQLEAVFFFLSLETEVQD